jgi:hypothetical protein
VRAGATIVGICGCQEPRVGPPLPPSAEPLYTLLTLDTPIFPVDVSGAWGGVSLMVEADQSLHIVSMDYWDNRLRYAGCANSCDTRERWLTGTIDSSVNGYGFYASTGATLTASGIHAVYMSGGPSGPSIEYAFCPGACQVPTHWDLSTLFPGNMGGNGPQTVPLASDSIGTLYLAYDRGSTFNFAQCSSICGATGSWQTVQLDTTPGVGFAIVATPGGTVHMLEPGGQVRYAACASACAQAGNWHSVVLDSAPGNGAALAIARNGTVHAAYLRADTVWYARCAGGCTAPGGWRRVRLAGISPSVALAVDAHGAVTLVTDSAAVTVARCAEWCLSLVRWPSIVADSAWGGGTVAVVLDSAGHAGVASALDRLQFTQMRR